MILITGASGFIGQHICNTLEDKQHPYITLGRQPIPNPNTKFHAAHIETDLSNFSRIDQLQNIDTLLHFAARVHVMRDRSNNPLQAFREVNTQGTLNLARQAAAAGVKQFIFASSIKVNGEGQATPYTEHQTPAPKDGYAQSKWEAEQGLAELSQTTGMSISILRLPLVYGTGVGANFQRLAQLSASSIPLPFAGINNQRSLLYVGNLVSAVLRLIQQPPTGLNTFMLCDDSAISTPELIHLLAQAQGKKARLFPVPTWLFSVLDLLGFKQELDRLTGSLTMDNRLFRERLDWQPPYDIEAGLKKMYSN